MIAIIGAGMAGLACARRLADAGRDVVVFDKGRGIGGRIATRRTEFGSFDHGAQYATAEGVEFSAYLDSSVAAGRAARWPEISEGKARIVGTPGMTALVRPLAMGLDIHRSTELSGLSRSRDGWQCRLADHGLARPFEQIVLTAPAPQTIELLGEAAHLFPELGQTVYAPCWTLMVAFETPLAAAPVHRGKGALGWAARNSAKPGREPAYEAWVAQAGPDWSRHHLELDREAASARLLDLMAETLGINLPEPVYVSAHRWRYARVEHALGTPFLHEPELGIGFAGDGFLGGRIEAAFNSGHSLAGRMLEQVS